MHEIAEATPSALAHLILAAAGLTEVRDGRQLGVHRPPAEPAIVQVVHRLFSVFLATKLKLNGRNIELADAHSKRKCDLCES